MNNNNSLSFYRTYRPASRMGADDGVDVVWIGHSGRRECNTEEIGPCYDPKLCRNDYEAQASNIVRMRGWNEHYITFELNEIQ